MSEIRVAVWDDYQGVASSCADWESLGCPVRFFSEHLDDRERIAERLAGYAVVVAMRERTPFPRELFAALPDLQLLVTTGMKNASIDLAAAVDHGVTVCGTRSPGHATAELTFAFIMMLARNTTAEISSVRAGGWQVGLGRDLSGATLGVIGLGRLGSRVARYGQAFGMEVLAWSENLTAARADEVGVRMVTKQDLLSSSDFVTIHLRLSERSRHLIGAGELMIMRPGAYLVNTSRGPIVDESALLDAVTSGHIAGAALDVYDREPLPSDHPFRTEPRILTTPHIGYVTRETYEIFYRDAVEDISAWMAGTPTRIVE